MVQNSLNPRVSIGPDILEQYIYPGPSENRVEQLRRLFGAWESLYWKASRMRELAGDADQQYRNFYVGCAILAFRNDLPPLQGRWQYFGGLNAKVECASRPVCAEAVAIQSAYAAGYQEIIGMVIMGNSQLDEHSKVASPTLHPCHECRLLMRKHPIMRNHTRILTALPPPLEAEHTTTFRTTWELHTLSQILKLHKEIDEGGS